MNRPRAVMELLEVLHRRGLERLRIVPTLSPSGVGWRYRIRPVTGIRWDHGALSAGVIPDVSGALLGQTTLGWGDAPGATPAQLADAFLAHAPAVADAGQGEDARYATWYARTLGALAPDDILYAQADHPVPAHRIAARSGATFPLPPPGEAESPDRSPARLPPWPEDKWTLPVRGPGTVLVMTGALNPIHRGHIAMMRQARALLRSRGVAVVGGLISPSSDHYLVPKYRSSRQRVFSAWQRLVMCQAATQASDWLDCAAWEAAVPDRWPDFPEVVDTLYRHIAGRHPGLTVTYVCGADHFRHLSAGLGHPGQRVIVIPRQGRPVAPDAAAGIAIAPPLPGHLASISATAVRQALAAGDPIDHLLHPDVVRILRVLAKP